MADLQPSHVVGIGGSAGALAAYKAVLDDLPANTGMAFVVISHMNPSAMSALAQILARHTTMEVRVAETGMALRRNRVYVIPPNADLRLDGGVFKVSSPNVSRGALGGCLPDVLGGFVGGAGRRRHPVRLWPGRDRRRQRIRAKGGATFAQDMSAEVEGMPLSAVASGCVDFVLPPDGIAARLRRLSALRKP
jgi:chemotaxis response regulator CheB